MSELFFNNTDYSFRKLNEMCSCKNSPLLMPDAKPHGRFDLYNANVLVGKCDIGEVNEYISIIKYGSGIGKVKLRPKYSNVIGTMGIINEKKDYDLAYLYYLLQCADFKKYIEVGTAPNMYFEDFGTALFSVPNLYVQHLASSFMLNIDSLIEAKEKALVKIEIFKKTMLSKMFPKPGFKVPEIRFKGFKNEWKNSNLEKEALLSKGHGYAKSDFTNEGNQLFLYGRMYTNYRTYVATIDTYTNKLYPNTVFSTGNEVVVPGSGETPEDISRATAITKAGIILGGDLNVIVPNSSLNNIFLALVITNTNFHIELSKKAQGATISHIHNDDFKDINFMYPEIAEQELIVKYFTQLDQLIDNKKKEIETLKHLKDTLLKKMFA